MSDATQDKKTSPPGWGEDPLSAFIDNAQHNIYASFLNLKPQYNLLKNIHQVFDTAVHNVDRSPDWFAAFFLFRSHSAFLEGVRLVLSGAIPESYMVLRGCLENAFYGFYLNGDHQRQETWLRRHDDEKSKTTVRKEFSIRNVLDFLKSKDESLYKVSNELYERSIDLGAHPNERAFLSVMRQKKDESEISFDSAYLIGNEPALQLGVKSSAQIGICALLIFQNIFKKRFELLGLSEQIDHLKRGL